MDAGIISIMNRSAWQIYLKKLMNNCNISVEPRLHAYQLNMYAGTKGVDQGHGPHVSNICK